MKTALLLRATCAAAALFTITPSLQAQQLADKDRDFLQQAAQNGLAEVESSKLAQQKATSPQVKQFAQHMIEDHTKANEELKQLAQSKGVEVPTEPSIRHKAQMKLLGTRDGKEFDTSYAEQMGVKAHEETVALFQKGSKEAQDPQVKSFATKTLPKLQEHLQMARKLKP